MFYFTDAELDAFIQEDVPFGDLTTDLLDIGNVQGKIRYVAREEMVVCGTEETVRIFGKLGLAVDTSQPSGARLSKGERILEGHGTAERLQTAWRACGRIVENASGIATRTAELVARARQVNPDIVVAATRKSFPGTKKLASKAVLAGGGIIHRLGLSETILVFEEHIRFMGGLSAFLDSVGRLKTAAPEKRIVAEAHDVETARRMIEAGVDIVQCDKLLPDMLRQVVDAATRRGLGTRVAAAGNVNAANVEEIASTGVDFLVTSAPYFGKPCDIGVVLDPR